MASASWTSVSSAPGSWVRAGPGSEYLNKVSLHSETVNHVAYSQTVMSVWYQETYLPWIDLPRRNWLKKGIYVYNKITTKK